MALTFTPEEQETPPEQKVGLTFTPEDEAPSAISFTPDTSTLVEDENSAPTVADHVAKVFNTIGNVGRRGIIPFKPLQDFNESVMEGFVQGAASAPIEGLGTIYSTLANDPLANNLFVKMGRGLREGTRSDIGDEDGFFTDQLPQAIGQTVSFATGGFLAKGPKWIAPLFMGGFTGGQSQTEDARALGATEEQVKMAFYPGFLFGTSEALPISSVLARADDATGGLISRRLKGKAANYLAQGTLGAIEEGMQEAFQTLGENITAADWVGYDPNRPITDNILDATEAGASTGFLLSLAATAMGVKLRDQKIQKTTQEIDEAIEELSKIAGPYSTIDEAYFPLLKQLERTKARIQEAGQIDTEAEIADIIDFEQEVEQAEETASQTNNKIVDLRTPEYGKAPALGTIQFADLSTEENYASRELERVNNKVLNAELEGKDVTPIERLQKTPVVVGLTRKTVEYENFLETVKQDKASFESEAAWREARNVESVEATLAALKEQSREEKALAKEVKRAVAKLRSTFKIDGKFLVVDNDLMQANGALGHFKLEDGSTVYAIDLNLGRLRDAAALWNEGLRKEQVKLSKSRVMETLFHEFGHAFAFNKLGKLFTKVNQGQATEFEEAVVRGLQADYRMWVKNNLNSPYRQFIRSYFAPLKRAEAVQAQGVTMQEFESGEALHSSLPQLTTEETLRYLFSFDEFLAEQFSRAALQFDSIFSAKEAKGFLKELAEDYRKLFSSAKGEYAIQSKTYLDFIRATSIHGQVSAIHDKMKKQLPKNIFDAIKDNAPPDMETANYDPMKGQVDRFNKFYDYGLSILQIAEQNQHIEVLQTYINTLRLWKNDINRVLANADSRLTEWRNLGKDQNEKLSRMLLDESVGRLPNGKFLKEPRFFTPEEKAKYGLDEKAQEVYTAIRQDFTDTLNQMEEVLVQSKREIFLEDSVRQDAEVQEIRKEFEKLRAQPYFPLMRFGKYTVKVVARHDGVEYMGRTYKEGQVIEFQAFEKEKNQKKEFREMKHKLAQADFTVSMGLIQDPDYSLQGLPLALIKELESKLGSTMTKEQQERIQELKKDVLPFRSFRKQFIRRKRVEGYSWDAQRAYANYMWGFGNHISRIQHEPSFRKVMKDLEDSKKGIEAVGGDATKRGQILDHIKNHHEYVMNPANEFVAIRSAAFAYYLGFNIKSAFVNMTQIPLVTYPYLAARYGDGKAVAQLTRAYKTFTQLYTNPSKVDAEIQVLVEKGMEEAWLDESLATELAIAASEGNLEFNLPRRGFKRTMFWISEKGAIPFHLAEKMNRHIAAIATYKLARAKGHTAEQGIRAARKAVEKTQFEYARWNRPRFMRGKVGGTVFVFWNYLQNALYFAMGGDPGAARMLLMLFTLAGWQGLPFGENIMDLVDAMSSWYKKKTGAKDPHTDVRTEMRDWLKDMEMNPDLVMHGLGKNTFGLANLGEYMGWPIPSVDLSGSLSMGRILPFTDLVRPGEDYEFDRMIAGGVESAGGAAVSGVANTLKAIVDNNPDQWKRWERALPAALKQVSKAARYASRGEEAARNGYPIATFDMNSTRDQLSVLGQALGFTPSEVTTGWQGYIAQRQAVKYYETWKSELLRQFNMSFEVKDTQLRKEVRKGIRKYNTQVPFPEMRIGYEVLRNSRTSYARNRGLNENELEPRKTYRRLSDEVKRVYQDE